MADKREVASSPVRGAASLTVVAYVVVALGTVVALAVMALAAPALATGEAWGHAVVVAAFAVLLPLRLAAARRGDPRALRAVTIIAGVLVGVNVVEAALPGVFPGWMRVEMVVIAVLMLGLAVVCVRARVR